MYSPPSSDLNTNPVSLPPPSPHPFPDSTHDSSQSIHSPPSKPHRHSFWAGLGFKDRSNWRKSSTVTLANYPHQQIYKTSSTLPLPHLQSSRNGASRVIAMVGNIRTGIGRMILEELVSQKFIVVALIEKPDSQFNRSVEVLASSPSLFHAFVVESGLFDHPHLPEIDQQIKPTPTNHLHSRDNNSNNNNNNNPKKFGKSLRFRSFRLGHRKADSKFTPQLSSTTTGSSTLGDSVTELSSYSSANSNGPSSTLDSSRRRTILELKNIFKAYRVDTVISSFEPQLLDQPAGPRSKARAEDEKQFGLPPAAERARIEHMERVVLEACLASCSVTRFAVTVHPTSLGPSVLSPNPTRSIRPHLMSVLSNDFRNTHSPPPINITEFRWGFLMNDLAFDDTLADGATAENGLGKWLCEPPKSRWVVDLARRRCLIPVRTSTHKESSKKGKQKLEPVCMTLAEDVARFIGLACKTKETWQWKTGKMVGDCVLGGWEETIETIERISRKKFDREYVCVGSLANGYASDSGSSNSSLDQQNRLSNSDPFNTNRISQTHKFSVEDGFQFEDELRSYLSNETYDASSVRMREFIRVWYTPLPQPPPITIDGSRLRQKSHRNSTSAVPSRGSFKPQVGENGTLREPSLKAATLNGRNYTDGTNPQFLTVQSSQSISSPGATKPIGQAISTDTPPVLSQLVIPGTVNQPPRILHDSPGQSSEDFNFVPKVVVPFNTTPQFSNSGVYQPPVAMNKPMDPFENRRSLQSHVPLPSGMVYGAPVATMETQQKPSHENSGSPASLGGVRGALGSYGYRPPSFGSPHHGFSHKNAGLSNRGREDNRLIRRSPLATRVA